MIQEDTQEKLIESWLEERGYTIAANRMELLARILIVNNPLFADQDFKNLKVLDIGCGGDKSPLQSEHNYDTKRLWEPWFLRISKLLNAKTRDGIDVAPQPQDDQNYQIYNHITADIFKAFLKEIPLQDLIQSNPNSYNLINCTNVIDKDRLSPYLENLMLSLGLQGQVDEIIEKLFIYIYNYAIEVLEENGLLAIDDQFFIKREGQLINLLEQ